MTIQTIEYRLGELTEAVQNLDHRLFGNGSEGVVQKHARELDLLKEAFLERRVKQQTILWMLRLLWSMITVSGGVLIGASSWFQKLHDLLRSLGW